MSSKKVLIMPNPAERALPEGEGPVLGPGPLSASDVRTLFTAVDIHRTLGRLEHAVEVLETTTKSHGEKVQQLIQKTDKTDFALPIIENAITRHGEELIQLGKEVHTAKTLGNIALSIIAGGGILLAVLIYLYHRLAPFFK